MHASSLRGVGRAVLLGVLLAAAPSRAGSHDAAAAAPLSPDAAVDAALSVHPEALAAQSELAIAHGLRAEHGLLLANPSASGTASIDRARTGFELTQPLSVTGEGWHARSSATARVDAADAALRRTRLRAAADVRQAYVDAVVATGRVRVATEGVELAAQLRRAVRRQHEEGEASTLDLRLARLAEVQAAAALMDARRVEADALATLAALVGRPVASDALVAEALDAAPEPTTALATERSDVLAARAALRSAEAQVRRQRAAAVPLVEVGVFVDFEDGERFVGPAVGVELPLFARNQVGRAEARAEVQTAGAGLQAIAARAETEALTAEGRLADARELRASLVADPVAEAREALRSIEAGYLAGEIDLSTTVLLQGEVLAGEAAALALLGQVADARLDLLLAIEDPALLGGGR